MEVVSPFLERTNKSKVNPKVIYIYIYINFIPKDGVQKILFFNFVHDHLGSGWNWEEKSSKGFENGNSHFSKAFKIMHFPIIPMFQCNFVEFEHVFLSAFSLRKSKLKVKFKTTEQGVDLDKVKCQELFKGCKNVKMHTFFHKIIFLKLKQMYGKFFKKHFPSKILLLQSNNRNTIKRCGICSKLPIKTSERRHWRHWCRYGVFIVNSEHIPHLFLVFLLLALNK